MTKPRTTDEEFIALWKEHQSVQVLSKILDISYRNVLKRKKKH